MLALTFNMELQNCVESAEIKTHEKFREVFWFIPFYYVQYYVLFA